MIWLGIAGLRSQRLNKAETATKPGFDDPSGIACTIRGHWLAVAIDGGGF